MTEGILVVSSNSGGDAIADPDAGLEITSGRVYEIYLNGLWIHGVVEHANVYEVERHIHPSGKVGGYHFIGSRSGICGLCEGMKVRIP